MKKMNQPMKNNFAPMNPNGDAGELCSGSEASGW